MATGKYIEMKELFSEYLTTKKLRKTEERFAVFECICGFHGHFDSESLYMTVNRFINVSGRKITG